MAENTEMASVTQATPIDLNLHDDVGDKIEAAGDHFVAGRSDVAARLLREAADQIAPPTDAIASELATAIAHEARPSEPQGEAVAYRYVHLDYAGRKVSRYGTQSERVNGQDPIEVHPLYAHPEPQARPSEPTKRFTLADINRAEVETERLTRELDITNADHIALWLESNMGDSSLDWLACRIVEALEAILANPPRHKFWGAGEPDCPREIKAGNGELHTLRCKVCRLDGPRSQICLPQVTASTPANSSTASEDDNRKPTDVEVQFMQSLMDRYSEDGCLVDLHDWPAFMKIVNRYAPALASLPQPGASVEAREALDKLLTLIETADEHGDECAIVEQAVIVRALGSPAHG